MARTQTPSSCSTHTHTHARTRAHTHTSTVTRPQATRAHPYGIKSDMQRGEGGRGEGGESERERTDLHPSPQPLPLALPPVGPVPVGTLLPYFFPVPRSPFPAVRRLLSARVRDKTLTRWCSACSLNGWPLPKKKTRKERLGRPMYNQGTRGGAGHKHRRPVCNGGRYCG